MWVVELEVGDRIVRDKYGQSTFLAFTFLSYFSAPGKGKASEKIKCKVLRQEKIKIKTEEREQPQEAPSCNYNAGSVKGECFLEQTRDRWTHTS